MELLLENLSVKKIPLSLLSQYLPIQYDKIRKGMLDNDFNELIIDHIQNVIDDYYYAIK